MSRKCGIPGNGLLYPEVPAYDLTQTVSCCDATLPRYSVVTGLPLCHTVNHNFGKIFFFYILLIKNKAQVLVGGVLYARR